MTFCDRLRAEREDHDESQRELAAILGVKQTVYWRYENGLVEMPIRHLITFCEHYGVSSDYILGLKKHLRWSR